LADDLPAADLLADGLPLAEGDGLAAADPDPVTVGVGVGSPL
jgi:hypothetical protein